MKYEFSKIEKTWQNFWEQNKTFKTLGPTDAGFDPKKEKFYVLDMFPYPSGVGLHVGHPLGYIATDVIARFKRMKGYNVLHPMGFDAFGLPAEQFAIETGTHPEITTQKNIANMIRQLKSCALSYDWDRLLSTTDEKYYRWTQWIFTKLFNAYYDKEKNKARPLSALIAELEKDETRMDLNGKIGSDRTLPQWKTLSTKEQQLALSKVRLAFADDVPVNWCPQLGTVLANEEVTIEGRSERGNFPVYKKPLKQWMLRITTYADRLIEDLEKVDWPSAVKDMQKNWVGKSIGAKILFDVVGANEKIEVFTTRPDTLFGATFMVLAPAHPLTQKITTAPCKAAVAEVVQKAAHPSHKTQTKDKFGAFTGAFAINPATQKHIPIWVADYVLMDYGTGAIMAVPGHDERDEAFATEHGLEVVKVFDEKTQKTVLSGAFNGLSMDEAKEKIVADLEQKQIGEKRIQYKLRDWLFSRQRYWGEPFPIVYTQEGFAKSVDEKDLPVLLPPMKDFKPKTSEDPQANPQTSLSKADESWKKTIVDGEVCTRELNTMPQWAGSCWYYLRFLDPHNEQKFVDPKNEKYWMGEQGVDLYVGGVEHAVLHLLYARFWHKVLYDLGFVSTPEPFGKLINQGYIQAFSYQDERGVYVDATQVKETAPGQFEHQGKKVQRNLGKMGKSLKNAVGPDEIIEKYGCDTFRLYEMYLGPLDQSKIWDTEAIVGVNRFLQRFWRNCVNEETGSLKLSNEKMDQKLYVKLQQLIHRVSSDLENLKMNTAIARMIEFNNDLVELKLLPREVIETFAKLLSPLAPHVCEEIWKMCGHSTSISKEPWPNHDPKALEQTEVEVVVQVNGKKRLSLLVPVESTQADIEALAKKDAKVIPHLEGKQIKKVIYVPKKIINIVV